MSNISDDLSKVFLFGVGAMAKTVEKASELVDALVSKGALTVEQGKSINEELKHKIQAKVAEKEKALNSDLIKQVKDMDDLSDDDIELLKAKIKEQEAKRGKEHGK